MMLRDAVPRTVLFWSLNTARSCMALLTFPLQLIAHAVPVRARLDKSEAGQVRQGVTGSGASRVGVAEIRLARSEGGAF